MTQSSEEQRSIPSEASSSSQTRDDLNYTQPSDATELVRQARDLSNRLRGRYAKGPLMANGEPEFGWAIFTEMPNGDAFPGLYTEAAGVFDQFADFITQAQARATAAEGEMPSREDVMNAILRKCFGMKADRARDIADAILALRKPSSAQQTITQLTRELETARKVLEPFAAFGANAPSWLPDDAQLTQGSPMARTQVTARDFRAAASFLSSLSHQDEQG